MLSNKKIICPNNLINVAKKVGIIDTGIVNAGQIFPMESVHKAVQHNLINPVFIGDKSEINKHAEKLGWNISKYKIIDEKDENGTAPIAAKLASEGKVKILVKGHMTLGADDNPIIITDGVVNVLPKLGAKMHILRNAVDFANKIGISKPKVSILSATEEVLESVPSSIEADLITKRAKKENINADVFGPLAFDNSISKKSASIKKIKSEVAGSADILLVPNVETGNALVKMMIYFMGACAAGVVLGGKTPIVITSRSDESEARLASIAAAVVALN